MGIFNRSKRQRINLTTSPQVEDDNNLLMSVAVLYFTKHDYKTYISRVLIIYLIWTCDND